MTENEALQQDANADASARLALCSTGPAECEGRNAKREDSAPVFNRVPREFRVYDGDTPTAHRKYRCRYCGTEKVIPEKIIPT